MDLPSPDDTNQVPTAHKEPRASKPSLVWPTLLMLTITPLVALIGIPWYQYSVGFEWTHWVTFAVVAALNGLSITAGYHRLWAHNAYKARTPLKIFLALFGAATFQNSILVWASQHRRHHRHVDVIDEDPYSAKKGLWFSHIGWMIRDYPTNDDDFSNVADLKRDKIVMWQHKYYYSLAIVMNILPPLVMGFITGDYLAHFLACGFLRLVYSHHTTFFINSLAHYWGRQPYTEENTARDNDLVAIFTYGEGYHNYHHLFQSDYRNGVRWWQFDPTKWLIKSASWLGLTYDLRQTPNFKICEAMVNQQLNAARQKLQSERASDRVKAYVEQESQHLAELLGEWRSTREQWISHNRDRLIHASNDLQKSLEQDRKAISRRMKELESSANQQYQRLREFNVRGSFNYA
ncbi:MAG: fatty acid desaturase [Pseudomonadales bacterium]